MNILDNKILNHIVSNYISTKSKLKIWVCISILITVFFIAEIQLLFKRILIFIKKILNNSPITISIHCISIHIELRIPFYKGIGFYYSFGNKTWHTGRHTFLIMKLKYNNDNALWCFVNWKFLYC